MTFDCKNRFAKIANLQLQRPIRTLENQKITMDLQGFNSGMSNTAFSITLDSIQEVRKLRIMNEDLND